MPIASDPTFLVVHALRVKGFAEPDAIAEMTGQNPDEIRRALELLAADELVSRRDGRVCGWTLTATGRTRHGDLLVEDRVVVGGDDLAMIYESFLGWNEEFKQLCTDWQLRLVGSEQVLNDHADAVYDAAIRDRLKVLHGEVGPAVLALGDKVPRFASYGGRLGRAADRFVSGEPEALARPLSGSYHDVWMELHQDLLLTLGRERDAADGH